MRRWLGISGAAYRSVVGDICNDRIADEIGPCFDITHLLRHHLSSAESPFDMIRNLISMTRERFILSSMVVPDRCHRKPLRPRSGTLSACSGWIIDELRNQPATGSLLLVPTLSVHPQTGNSDRAFSARWELAPGDSRRVQSNPPVMAGWSFQLLSLVVAVCTAETLVSMCEMFGVVIEKTWIELARLSKRARARRPDGMNSPHQWIQPTRRTSTGM